MAEPILKWQANENVSLEPDAEPIITGKMEFDGEHSTGLAERHDHAYADQSLPLKFALPRDTRGRACKKPRRTGGMNEDEDEDEDGNHGEDEEEEEDRGSDSDFTDDGGGVAGLGSTQPTLPKGRFELDRDHELFNKKRREDEQFELIVGEPVDGVRAVSGRSKTMHNDSTLMGLVTAEGLLYLYMAEDVVDAARESASAGKRKKKCNTAASLRAKLVTPASMRTPVPKWALNTTPQFISGKSSTVDWTFQKALLEIGTNLRDQAQVTAKEEFPFTPPPVEHHITRRKGGWIAVTYFAGHVKLAEITYRKKDAKWTKSWTKSKSKYVADEVDSYPTWELTFKNYGAHIKPQCFLRGVSGAEKEGNPDVMGKYGDGLTMALDFFLRRAMTVLALTAGYTTTAILDSNGHSYIQHTPNKQEENTVVFKLTFMPKQPHLLEEYLAQYTEHWNDPIDPDTFDPTSMYLSGSVDRVSVYVDGPGTYPAAIILDGGGKFYIREVPVSDNGEGFLFSYSFPDRGRKLVQGRDRGAMKPKLTRPAVDKLICAGIEKSPRLRRKLVMELTQGVHYDDIRPKKWSARAVELIQQESRKMFEGTILLSSPTPLCTTMIAELRDLKPMRCPSALDEGKALVADFVEELRSLPRDEIGGQDGACAGWASTVREELLRLTGATSVASVEFPGKLGEKDVVWVEKDVVLISRRSLKVRLQQEDFKTAKFLLDIISCSMHRDSYFTVRSELPFEVYHLICSAELCPEEPSSVVMMNGARDAPNGLLPGDGGAQGLPTGDGENTGPEVAPDGASAPPAASAIAEEQASPEATAAGGREGGGENAGPEAAPSGASSGPTPASAVAAQQASLEETDAASGPASKGENSRPEMVPSGASSAPVAAAAIAEEQAHPEPTAEESGPARDGENARPGVAPCGAPSAPTAAAAIAEEQTHPEETAEQGGDESDGIEGAGMEDDPRDSEESSLCGGKRASDTVEAEAATKRTRQEGSGSEGGGSGSGETPPASAQVASVAAKVTGTPSVSIKVESSTSSSGGAFASVKLEEPRSSEGGAAPAAGPVQSAPSDEAMVLEGLGVSQEVELGEVEPPAPVVAGASMIPAPERNGEELGAFLSNGDFVPALIHVERRAIGGEGGSVDLYRIAGRRDNAAELLARFSAVVASERARRVLESAVKKPGVDISLFCWNEPDALAAFVGQGAERIFVNLHHGSKSVDEWGVDDLPTQIASAVAHVRSATPATVRSHAWSVEFRKWVISEDL